MMFISNSLFKEAISSWLECPSCKTNIHDYTTDLNPEFEPDKFQNLEKKIIFYGKYFGFGSKCQI